jgi:hypothetical protein
MSVIDKDNLLYDDTNSFCVVRTCVVTGIGKFIGDCIVLDIVESSVIPVVVKSFSVVVVIKSDGVVVVVVVVLEILGTANKYTILVC